MISWLKGKKTYLAGGGLILTGASAIIAGSYVEGAISILNGLGFIFLRKALVQWKP